jgi:Rrf2 family protein
VISQTAEYALRAAVDLAYHHGASRTTREIAAATHVPPSYLSKILQDLARAGLVRSQRGLHGGFALTRAPSTITVYDIMQAVDPIKRIRECPLGLASHRHQLCPLHHRLDAALARVERAFRAATLAAVTASPSRQPLRESRTALTVSGGLAPRPRRAPRRAPRRPS